MMKSLGFLTLMAVQDEFIIDDESIIIDDEPITIANE